MIAPDTKSTPEVHFDAITRYVEGVSFKKKVFGGYDEEEVLVCLKELTDLFRAEEERLCAKVEQATERVARSDERSLAMDKLLLSVQDVKQDILTKAEKEAQALLDQVTEEVAAIRAEACAEADRVRDSANQAAKRMLQQAEEETEAMRMSAERRLRNLVSAENTLSRDLGTKLAAMSRGLSDVACQISASLAATESLTIQVEQTQAEQDLAENLSVRNDTLEGACAHRGSQTLIRKPA